MKSLVHPLSNVNLISDRWANHEAEQTTVAGGSMLINDVRKKILHEEEAGNRLWWAAL